MPCIHSFTTLPAESHEHIENACTDRHRVFNGLFQAAIAADLPAKADGLEASKKAEKVTIRELVVDSEGNQHAITDQHRIIQLPRVSADRIEHAVAQFQQLSASGKERAHTSTASLPEARKQLSSFAAKYPNEVQTVEFWKALRAATKAGASNSRKKLSGILAESLSEDPIQQCADEYSDCMNTALDNWDGWDAVCNAFDVVNSTAGAVCHVLNNSSLQSDVFACGAGFSSCVR